MSNPLSVRRVKVQTIDSGGHPEGEPSYGVMAADSYAQSYNDTFESIDDLNDAIEALEKWDRRKNGVLEMKYFAGMSREEIADALGVSLGTVKRDLSIAEAFLRREMNRE